MAWLLSKFNTQSVKGGSEVLMTAHELARALAVLNFAAAILPKTHVLGFQA